MNHRLTIAAAIAVILASVSEYVLINGGGWLVVAIGAVIVVAGAGTLTRLAPNQAAIGATILAVIASVPLLTDRSVLIKLAGVVIIGCCAASASRVRVAKPVADLVTYLAALFLYLNLAFAASKSWAYVVPTSRSVRHLMDLAHHGSYLAKNSPPVAAAAGVLLLAGASIGLSAIVVDIVAVRLNRPAIAGLPLLVLYMAPIATAAKVSGPGSVVTFLLAATGYLGLLASDGRSRLRGWGRIITVWHYSGEDDKLGGADIRGLAATGRRIGVAAVCAAVIAPLLLPTLNLHRLFSHGHGSDVVGIAGLPNPIDEMHALLTDVNVAPVLSYRSNGADTGQYLQVYVLNYDSPKGQWQLMYPTPALAVGQSRLYGPQGLDASTSVVPTKTRFSLDAVVGGSAGYDSPDFFLPVPYWPTGLNVPGAWNEAANSLMVFSPDADHSGLRYTVTNDQPVLTPAEEDLSANTRIPAPIRSRFGHFESSVTARLTGIARQITKGDATPFEKAVALEKYFQSGLFTYTLSAINLPNNASGLLTFLTTDRHGFCEQFAFAMAVLARLVGIPSRIAIGFTPGTEQSGGIWQVTTADAHAWPELYFPRIGWLRFEPTPAGPNGVGTAQQPSYAVGGSGPSGHESNPSGSQSGNSKSNIINSLIHHLDRQAPGTETGRQVGTLPLTHNKGAAFPVVQVLLGMLALLIVMATVPGIARIVARRRRWRTADGDAALARAAWQEVCADLEDFGLTHRLSESPRALAKRISLDADIDEPARQAIGRIATVVERCRYAQAPASADGIRADVAQVRRSLAHNATVIQRLQARLAPASVLAPVASSARRSIAERTGWMPSYGES